MNADNKFTRHLYQSEPTECQYRLFKLHFLLNGHQALTQTIKIEPHRKHSYGTGFDDWLILKDKKHWNKCKRKTGLRPTQKENCFYGDLLQTNPKGGISRSLVIVQFSTDKNTMVVDYFKGFNPANETLRYRLFNNHKFYW